MYNTFTNRHKCSLAPQHWTLPPKSCSRVFACVGKSTVPITSRGSLLVVDSAIPKLTVSQLSQIWPTPWRFCPLRCGRVPGQTSQKDCPWIKLSVKRKELKTTPFTQWSGHRKYYMSNSRRSTYSIPNKAKPRPSAFHRVSVAMEAEELHPEIKAKSKQNT